jgi:hypothetical protein
MIIILVHRRTLAFSLDRLEEFFFFFFLKKKLVPWVPRLKTGRIVAQYLYCTASPFLLFFFKCTAFFSPIMNKFFFLFSIILIFNNIINFNIYIYIFFFNNRNNVFRKVRFQSYPVVRFFFVK